MVIHRVTRRVQSFATRVVDATTQQLDKLGRPMRLSPLQTIGINPVSPRRMVELTRNLNSFNEIEDLAEVVQSHLFKSLVNPPSFEINLLVREEISGENSVLSIPLMYREEKIGSIELKGKMPPKIQKQAEAILTYFSETVSARIGHLLEALTDGLTGIYNKRHFDACLIREVNRAKRDGTPLSLVMIDLDHFKRVNDTHGHPTGSIVLRQFSRLVKKQLRNTDLFFRYGGEEFAILMPNTDKAEILAERIREALHQTQINGIDVRASIGIAYVQYEKEAARYSDSKITNEEIRDIIRQADTALFIAKGKRVAGAKMLEPEGTVGRDRIVILCPNGDLIKYPGNTKIGELPPKNQKS